MMEQKEKLIELLVTASDLSNIWKMADFLLANGVVVLPCKVGDTVYVPYPALHSVGHFQIESIETYKDGTVFCTDTCGVEFNASDFGKTVFTTKEEAERALQNEKAVSE